MKKLILGFLAVLAHLFLLNCKDDDGYSCFTPPDSTVFEFVNSAGENLIQNGGLDLSKISVKENNGNGTTKDMKLFLQEDYKIGVLEIGWIDGTKNYEVTLMKDPVTEFNFKVTSSKITGKCGGYRIKNFQIENIQPKKMDIIKLLLNKKQTKT